jgi:hypothetical protein
MEMANGDVDCIPRCNLMDVILYLHQAMATLDNVDLFHRIHMADEFFPRSYGGMGEKHQGLEVAVIKEKMGHPTSMGLIAGFLHLRVL